MASFDPSTQASLRAHLLPGERLLWSGKAKQGILLRRADLYLVPFSLLWGGFALFWNIEVWTMDSWSFLALWGIPFLLVGLYIVAGRFLHDAWLRAGIVYAVTDRRVLIARTGSRGGLKSFEIGYLPMLALEENRDGSGTIQFDTLDEPDPRFGAALHPFLSHRASAPWFDTIEQPRIVYDLICREAERVRLRRRADLPPGREFIG